jgi:hypothetical protein
MDALPLYLETDQPHALRRSSDRMVIGLHIDFHGSIAYRCEVRLAETGAVVWR